ncbi:glycosyltransferase family 2 protein, partial [Bosea thiooxidans]
MPRPTTGCGRSSTATVSRTGCDRRRRRMKKVAVVTMQFNEAFYVSRWIDYYAALVGRENLYVVDHDSDDEVREILRGVSVV